MHPSSSNTRSTALRSGLAAFSIVLAATAALFGEEPPTGNQGQLGVAVTWIEVPDSQLRGSYRVRNPAQSPEVTLYWGTQEGLTFADRWEKSVRLGIPLEGENTFAIDNVPSDKTVHVRLLLKNGEGQFWSPTTLKVEPHPR
jgi:hypothetical protein